ncbi:MAG: glycosyltransferase family 1 protein [Candidatus Korobacteraceae bacterium]
MKRVVIDARCLLTGIGTYTLNLVRGLKSFGDFHLRALTLEAHKDTLHPFCDEVDVVNAPIYSFREQVEIARAAHPCDLLHVPHYNAPLLHRGTMLVSIHDLTHILDDSFRSTWKSRIYAQPMLRMAASNADHIFTVSEYSKRQIIEHLDVHSDKVTVVYNGVSPQFFPEARDDARRSTGSRHGFEGPYLLYVGNLKPHKNVAGLLRAFALARSRGGVAHKLLVVGNDVTGRPQMMTLAKELGLNGSAVFVPSVSVESLRTIYSGADLTILPSFEEGFGLPIVESMACGTPVSCSSAASMPEVGGDAAAYFDPAKFESIAHVMEQVLSSPERMREMRELGIAQAARFTWESCARKHYDVYRGYLN